MTVKLFDKGFACDGNLYTYIDNVMISTSITVLCVFLRSFCVPEHDYKVPAESESANFKRFIKNHTYIWIGKIWKS